MICTLVTGPLALAIRARGQTSTATQLQIDLSLAFVSLTALRTRYGDSHPDLVSARARVASLTASLRAALARSEPIDVPTVTAALELEPAEVEALA